MADSTRRSFLLLSTTAGASLVLGACKKSISGDEAAPAPSSSGVTNATPAASSKGDANGKGDGKGEELEVTATEDLMREHGVIRRAIIVYRESAAKLRANAAGVSPAALEKTAKLFRTFAEDYHEKKLEEAILFPAVQRAGGAAAALIAPLIVQHERGRQVNDYVLAAVKGGKIGVKGDELAKVLESFARMYEAHAAREDTIVFPAWKQTMDPKQYDEMGERFEDIEKQTFGHDGFDDANDQIGAVEQEIGLADLAIFTPPPPPTTK